MAPNVNSAISFSRLDGINSNGLNKEVSRIASRTKVFHLKNNSKRTSGDYFCPPYIYFIYIYKSWIDS